MSDWPDLAYVLFTYAQSEDGPRAQAAESTLRAFLDHVRYSGHLSVHIADDGSPAAHRERLHAIAGGYEQVHGVGVTNAERGGYGKSYNLATQAVHNYAEIVVPSEDDWRLTRDLDLDPLVRTLIEVDEIRCIRLGYIGWTQPLWGNIVSTPAGTMLLFAPESRERHVFAGHVRIETRDFERDIGPWPEGIQAGATEFEVSGRWVSRSGVAWPLDYGPASQRANSLFVHADGGEAMGEVAPGA